MRTALLLTLSCCLAAPAQADAPTTHALPMWMQSGHPTVAVHLGDSVEPLHFVLDSAASATVIDQATARRLGLDDAAAEGVAVEGAADSSAILKRTRTTAWRVGTLQFQAAAMQTDLSRLGGGRGIDGILGNDVTDRFDMTFDIPGQRVQLQPAGTLAHRRGDAACQPNALPQRDSSMTRFGFVNLQLGAEAVDAVAVVDTGAAQTVLNTAAASALGLRTDGSDTRLRVREKGTRGLGERVMQTWLYTLPALRMGSWQHAPLEVRISELPVFGSLGLKARPALILGADALRGSQLQVGGGAQWICLRGAAR